MLPTPVCRLCLLLALALPGCAEGGDDDRPKSEVQVAASHHFFGFRSLPTFSSFPVVPEQTFPDQGTFDMFADSTYTVTRASGTPPPDSYFLEAGGALTVLITGSGREPSVVFRGAYGLNGDNSDLFFTDRVSNQSSPSLGMFFGTRIVPGQTELEGGWHLMSLHVIFADSSLLPEPRNIGRAARGKLQVAAGAPGTTRAITGLGTESSGSGLRNAVEYGGSIQDILDGNGQGDGTLNLAVSYRVGTQAADSRAMRASAGQDIVLAVDADETDGEAGLLFLMRAFDAPATVADPTRVHGEFLIGAHTLFINPLNAGTDAAIGRLTLTPQGAFQLDMVGSRGIDFAYTGTYTLDPDGSLLFDVDGTDEDWFGAIGRGYNTLAIVDDFVETRSNATPEVNLFLAVREKAP